jgi:hypothetical protein
MGRFDEEFAADAFGDEGGKEIGDEAFVTADKINVRHLEVPEDGEKQE